MPNKIKDFIKPYQVSDGSHFNLKDHSPVNTGPFKSGHKEDAEELLQRGVEQLSELQEKLYAQDHWGLLLIFQAMDAAGKDSTIKHVMSGVNPQGCQVFSFKSPSSEELDHDFLWRTLKVLPERGRIGIFNRSYYEEVLVVRVHPEILQAQKIPSPLVTKHIWEERFEDINSLERYLTRNGIAIRKFFLNVSLEEQRKRFVERIREPAKNWKFSTADVSESDRWDDYMQAYEEMIRHTSTKHAPWYVVPADHKWFTRLVVAAAVVDALEEMNLAFPEVSEEKRKELEALRLVLSSDRKRIKKERKKEKGD